jgi:hypothetical protein
MGGFLKDDACSEVKNNNNNNKTKTETCHSWCYIKIGTWESDRSKL